MHSLLSTLILISIVAVPAAAAPREEPSERRGPWAWTVSERLHDRFDAAKMQERLRAYREERQDQTVDGIRGNSTQSGITVLVVDGSRNPELFLPYELMNAILRGIDRDPSSREHNRRLYDDVIGTFGWNPADFWSRLDMLAAGYAGALDQYAAIDEQLGRTPSTSERHRLEALQEQSRIEICRQRVAVLRSARAMFGASTFDRFLYTAVAPMLSVVTPSPSSDAAAQLQAIEEGCR